MTLGYWMLMLISVFFWILFLFFMGALRISRIPKDTSKGLMDLAAVLWISPSKHAECRLLKQLVTLKHGAWTSHFRAVADGSWCKFHGMDIDIANLRYPKIEFLAGERR